FLTRAGGAAIAMPSLAAILAACSKPGESASGSGSASEIPIATLDNPVELPLTAETIPADTPLESGPLVLYNWADYIHKKVVEEFEEEFGVSVEITTFNNMEEGIQKVANGQVTPDVFVPTPGYLRRLVDKQLVMPLQHELVPNLEAVVWPSYSNPGPYYDLKANYTVPYTIYTWGVAYRRDRVSDEEAAAAGWDALWDPNHAGEIVLYDSYGDTIAVTILRNGSLDVNTGDPALITAAKESILETINENQAALKINGIYAKLPAGDYTVGEAWSGDIVGAQWYLPKGVGTDVLGFWRPPTGQTMIGNDLLVVPAAAKNPRLAHEFINFMLDEKHGYDNFVNWNGYQPPFTSIDPDKLIDDGVVPENLAAAVVTEDMFKKDLTPVELPPSVDQLWLDAWAEIKAGA
ncbi:MAG TPA: extracellular solute-binding protein, partial [Actinomycetota bacterium]|nr:extracellular solute-binding protein [Actinomycetota bacterium]